MKQEKDDFLEESMVIGVIAKGDIQSVRRLKQLLNKSGVQVVYKTLSYAPLYITKQPPSD